MTGKPVVFGADYSVYVRIVRLALEEKGVDYDLVPIDAFASGGPDPTYLQRQPFGRIPAFEHDGFQLYETSAIARYIDEAFDGPRLQPADLKARARMNQIISIADSYLYHPLVWDVFVERINKPLRGETPDEGKINAGLGKAQTALGAIAMLMADNSWLAGNDLTLADFYLAAMIDYFQMTKEGGLLLRGIGQLEAWWSVVAARPAMCATCYPPPG